MNLASENILTTKNLSKIIKTDNKELVILKPISINVKSGETLAIVGSSGSGKTTLLSILAGLDLPTEGEVFLKDNALHQLNEEKRSKVRADHVGFIFQSFLLINSLTALENVMLPAELANDSQAREKALALLDDVGLTDRADHFPNQLSGGEQQRVAIARAFINKPDVLFADEPTGNLDKTTGKTIEDLLFKLNEDQQTTLVLVTHDPKLAQRCARQLIMEAGSLVENKVTDTIESSAALGAI